MDVQGQINFLADLPLYEKEKPYGVTLPANYEPPNNVKLTNLNLEERILNIQDMRNRVTDFTLDTAGFMLLQQPTRFAEIEDMTAFEAYKRETEQILQTLLEPELVVCWDARLRSAARLQKHIEVEDLRDKLTGFKPVNLAHTDETFANGHGSIELALTDEHKAKYMRGGYRLRMIKQVGFNWLLVPLITVCSTWRPLIDKLQHYPLAVLDYRTITPTKDFVPYDEVSPIRHKEHYLVKPKEWHQWYWVSQQKKTELLVFVQYDSSEKAHVRCCPHAGFRNQSAPPDAELRRSIETRSVIITKDA